MAGVRGKVVGTTGRGKRRKTQPENRMATADYKGKNEMSSFRPSVYLGHSDWTRPRGRLEDLLRSTTEESMTARTLIL